jgi:hypothetical protein
MTTTLKPRRLSDGITIEPGSGYTGLKGSVLSQNWAQTDPNGIFLAQASYPKHDPDLCEMLDWLKPGSPIHFGMYSNPQEAAYVVACYDDDPWLLVEWLIEARAESSYARVELELPADLMSVPALVTAEMVSKARDTGIIPKAMRKLTGDKPEVDIRSQQLEAKRMVKRQKGVDLSNATHRMLFDKKHGADVVLEAILTLTGPEFIRKFWA